MKTKAIAVLSAIVFSAFGALFADDSARSNFEFYELVKWGRGINNKFQAISGGFEMQAECDESGKSSQTACVNRKMTVAGQDRLVFTVTGTPENKSSMLTIFVIFNIDGKAVTKTYRKVPINTSEPKTYSLGMSEIFGAPDSQSEVVQLKFGVDSSREQAGHVSKVKITDVAIRSAGDNQ